MEASSTAKLVMSITRSTPSLSRALRYESTVVNAMFTCIFLTYLGIYFTFFLLAAALGTYVGANLFSLAIKHRPAINHHPPLIAAQESFSSGTKDNLEAAQLGAVLAASEAEQRLDSAVQPLTTVHPSTAARLRAHPTLGTPSQQKTATPLAVANSVSILTDVLMTAALLGPFVIFFQTLGGSAAWWALLLGPSIARPATILMVRHSNSTTKAYLALLTSTCASCVAARCLWGHVTHGLQTISILHVSGWFTLAMFCTISTTVAVGIFMACESLTDELGAPEWGQGIAAKMAEIVDGHVLQLLERPMIWDTFNFIESKVSISWLLSMDALATMYYHLIKTLFLGVVTHCFYNWLRTPQAIWVILSGRADLKVWMEANFMNMALNNRTLPMKPDDNLPWQCVIVVFPLCCIISIYTIKLFDGYQEPPEGTSSHQPPPPTGTSSQHQPPPVASRHRPPQTTSNQRPPTATNDYQEPLTAATGQGPPATTNNRPQPPTTTDCHQQPPTETSGHRKPEMVRRFEFLLVGLIHWILTFIRRKMEQQAMPHNFTFLNLPIARNLTDGMIISRFHQLLNQTYSLQMPADDVTIFDGAYLAWDKYCSYMLHVEGWAIFLVLLATVLHRKFLPWSRCCIFCASILAAISAFMQIMPNYIAILNLDQYYAGCGESYDAYVKLLWSVVSGAAISAVLGWKVFSSLLSLPISLVRGIWLFILEEKDEDVRSVLSCLMRYLAVIIPLTSAFPLLFAAQLTESRRVWQPLLGFWIVPQLWIISRPSSSFEQWNFYAIWICLYLGFFCWFVFTQIDMLNVSILRMLQDLDWPYVWSLLHAEFCIMNVVVTDTLEMIMRATRQKRQGEEEEEEV